MAHPYSSRLRLTFRRLYEATTIIGLCQFFREILKAEEGTEIGEGEDEDDAETVEEAVEPERKSIEVRIAPEDGTWNKKGKKKGFDLEAHIKREVEKAKRIEQANKHKVHVLCLIGHLRHLNRELGEELVLAAGLSVVPEAQACSQRELNKARMSQFMAWFRSVFTIRFEGLFAPSNFQIQNYTTIRIFQKKPR